MELYGQVPRAVYVEGINQREAARRFRIDLAHGSEDAGLLRAARVSAKPAAGAGRSSIHSSDPGGGWGVSRPNSSILCRTPYLHRPSIVQLVLAHIDRRIHSAHLLHPHRCRSCNPTLRFNPNSPMRGGSVDRPGFAPGAWVRRILLPCGLARPGRFRADAPAFPLLCRVRRQYTRRKVWRRRGGRDRR